jgi:hypothetical protein
MNFTLFTTGTWHAFAGAQRLRDGSGPFVGTSGEYIVIVSGIHEQTSETMIEVTKFDGGHHVCSHSIILPTPALAMRFASGLSHGDLDAECLIKFGFEHVA